MKSPYMFEKEVLIRLTDEGFVSTLRYGRLYAKRTAWSTGSSEERQPDDAASLVRVKSSRYLRPERSGFGTDPGDGN